ncbi:hypothetical protein I4F81_012770 [Pyropia yezoensis]|uniref:Uncharacterized protein n=1 Tax=Pyropia yezoensis TaxID=2788 RepID=A0ACC3CJP8_PYRYE|nr:hypothetical protein I4F81_012770 [Neopyropia yezoensis]
MARTGSASLAPNGRTSPPRPSSPPPSPPSRLHPVDSAAQRPWAPYRPRRLRAGGCSGRARQEEGVGRRLAGCGWRWAVSDWCGQRQGRSCGRAPRRQRRCATTPLQRPKEGGGASGSLHWTTLVAAAVADALTAPQAGGRWGVGQPGRVGGGGGGGVVSPAGAV